MPIPPRNSDHDPAEPGERLLALHRAGLLPAEYPRVCQLLSRLSAAELPRAGRLLARLDPDEVLRAHPAIPAVTVAVTGHGTLAPLVPALTAEFARHGMLLRSELGHFDSWVFDLSDSGSALYAADPQLVLCVLDPAVITDELPLPWRPEDLDRVVTDKLRLIDAIVGTFEARAAGTLVLNTVPLSRLVVGQLLDHRSQARAGAIWRRFNARLLDLVEDHPAVVVIDLDPLVGDGLPVSEARLDIYARTHLSPELLSAYATEVGHQARSQRGQTKKCLVLDLDNTIWGGVVGDDGVEGIEVADSYRGEAFRSFQRLIKQFGAQGVLLAAVSKNDAEPVRRALRDHPRMTLRENDFVRVVANWRPKHENLLALAGELNLGVDSFVFVDDSEFECGSVRHALPEVTVIQLDAEPALHAGKLLRDRWFAARELTTEDLGRAAKYRAEVARGDFRRGFGADIDGYLAGLDIEVGLAPVLDGEIARTAQLTQRTNQFNLTTVRLQQRDVRALRGDPEARILVIRYRDRFGDGGVVGAIFLRRAGHTLSIDNFLLSCRVFSRGIEQACLSAVLRRAREAGLRAVDGAYRPTAKNRIVRDFYPRHGFRAQDRSREGAITFRHDLLARPEIPGHLRFSDDFHC